MTKIFASMREKIKHTWRLSFISFFVFFFFCLSFVGAVQQQLNVVITPYKQYGILAQDDIAMLATVEAIYAANAPIVTKQAIIFKLLKFLNSSEREKKQALNTSLFSKIAQLAHFAKSPLSSGMTTLIALFSKTLLDPGVWKFYRHDDSDSFVLVPKKLEHIYGEKTFNFDCLTVTTIEDISKTIDFNEEIDDLSTLYAELLAYVKKDASIFTELGLCAKTYDYKDFTASDWQKFLTLYKRDKRMIFEGFFDYWLKKARSGKSEKPSYAFDAYVLSQLENAARAGQCNAYSPLKIKTVFKNNSGPWNVLLIGHGALVGYDEDEDVIAEFGREEFIDFLLFLNNDIYTRLLVYKSCGAGGVNSLRHYWSDTHECDLKLNFTVVCCSLNNWPVLTNLMEFMPSGLKVPGLFLPPLLFGKRIEPLNNFVKKAVLDTDGFFANLNGSDCAFNVDKKALIAAIQCLTPSLKEGHIYKRMTHLPKVRYAHENAFTLFNICPHDLELISVPADIKVENKRVILLNTPHIGVLDFAGNILPAIVSGSPCSAIHCIKRIKAGVSLDVLLDKCFFFHPLNKDRHKYKEVPYVQIFLIDAMVLAGKKMVTDVMVVLAGEEYCVRVKRDGNYFWGKRSKQEWKKGLVWSTGKNEQLFDGYIAMSRNAPINLPAGLQKHIVPFMA